MKPGSLTHKLGRLRPTERSTANDRGGANVVPGDALAFLREQMARLLVRQERPRQSMPAPTEQDEPNEREQVGFDLLPVSQVDTPDGPIWRKLWRIPLEYRVGVATCHHARAANWLQVSLLALSPELVGTNAEELLFLDTETTGLGGAGVVAFLVGLAFIEDGEFWVEQLLLEGPEQEAALLGYVQARLATRPVVVSFNGKTFDWPLLLSRYAMHRLPAPPTPRHLDLLHVARRLHKGRLGSCNLRTLEIQVLGFERLGDIDGMEVAARYSHYLRSGDASGLTAVLEHNFWDVLSMLALVGLYGASDLVLPPADLASAARTLARAKALPEALFRADQAVANLACASGPTDCTTRELELARVHLVRGEIRKALGDRSGAIDDFTRAHQDPKARLELAKLYEHFLKDLDGASQWAERGTGERPEAVHRRLARLDGKRAKSRSKI
jgi:uncharacterized protein